MVLKIVQWVHFTGSPLEHDYLNNPADWNYWKREALAHQSGILNKVQGDLVPVKCFHTSESTDTNVWIWQEEVLEPNRSNWTLDRHILAARHFGEFGGAYAGFSPSANDNPWICRQFIRRWARLTVKFGLSDIAQNSEFWNHPYTHLALPPITEQRVQGLIDQIGRLYRADPETRRTDLWDRL